MTADTPHSDTDLEGRPLSRYTVEGIPAPLAAVDDLKRLVVEQQRIIAELKSQLA